MMNAELFDSLSEREKEVLRLLAEGHEAKSVAQTLGLSVHTVNEYLRAARRKLDAPNSRTAARQLAAYEQEASKKFGTPEFLGDEKTGEAQAGIGGHSLSSTGGRSVRLALWVGGFMTMFVILASVVALSTGMMTLGAPAQSAQAEASNILPAEATEAAGNWLKLVDEKQWSASHQAMSATVKNISSDAEWEATLAPVRESLGAFNGRTPSDSNRDSILPGMPNGDYGIQQFKSRFANHPDAVETVIMSNEAEGWKVIGYFVR